MSLNALEQEGTNHNPIVVWLHPVEVKGVSRTKAGWRGQRTVKLFLLKRWLKWRDCWQQEKEICLPHFMASLHFLRLLFFWWMMIPGNDKKIVTFAFSFTDYLNSRCQSYDIDTSTRAGRAKLEVDSTVNFFEKVCLRGGKQTLSIHLRILSFFFEMERVYSTVCSSSMLSFHFTEERKRSASGLLRILSFYFGRKECTALCGAVA